MKRDISLCMIVKNEESRLEGCLASTAPFVDEMIIVDTGSTDDTIRIARKYGAKVVHALWENDFAKARNTALRLAAGRWVLCLDADERLMTPPPGYLELLVQRDDVHGYYVQIRSFIGATAGGDVWCDEACRLFRNDPRIRFSRPIHEQVVPSLLALPGAMLLRSKLTVLHEGYLDPVIAEKNKSERNMLILQTALSHDPNDPEFRYAYGTELYQLQKYDEALFYFLPLLDANGARGSLPDGSGQRIDLTLKAAYALNATGRTEEAVLLLRKELTWHPDHPELIELLAGLNLEMRRPLEAVRGLERMFLIGNADSRPAMSGSGSYRSMHLAGLAFERLGMFREAVNCFSAALSVRPDYIPSWSRLPVLALLTDQEEMLSGLLTELHKRVPSDIWVSILHETIYTGKEDFGAELWERHIPEALHSLYYPMWEGIVVARRNPDAACRLFGKQGGRPDVQWYLWALRAKTAPESLADCPLPGGIRNPSANCPNPGGIRDPLADCPLPGGIRNQSADCPIPGGIRDPLADCPIPGGIRGPLAEPLYRRCQDVLLQVGAWEALQSWMELCTPVDVRCRQASHCPRQERSVQPDTTIYPLLPVHRYYAYWSAPPEAAKTLLRAAERWRETLSAKDGLALGALAFHAGSLKEALDWFRFANQRDPSLPEPSAASAYTHRLTAYRLLPARLSGLTVNPEDEPGGRALLRYFTLPV